MYSVEPSAPDAAEGVRDVERQRLLSLVEANAEVADGLHASDFTLVNPSGEVWSRDHYLGGIASGTIKYRRFEAVSDIEAMVEGNLAVVRYRSAIDIEVRGQEAGSLQCWHTDCYRRDGRDSGWQVVWSQATAIRDRPAPASEA